MMEACRGTGFVVQALQFASGGVYRAAAHRVIRNAAQLPADRLSSVFELRVHDVSGEEDDRGVANVA